MGKMLSSHIYDSFVSKRAEPALEQGSYLESTLVLKFKGQKWKEGTLKEKREVEGINEGRERTGEGKE